MHLRVKSQAAPPTRESKTSKQGLPRPAPVACAKSTTSRQGSDPALPVSYILPLNRSRPENRDTCPLRPLPLLEASATIDLSINVLSSVFFF